MWKYCKTLAKHRKPPAKYRKIPANHHKTPQNTFALTNNKTSPKLLRSRPPLPSPLLVGVGNTQTRATYGLWWFVWNVDQCLPADTLCVGCGVCDKSELWLWRGALRACVRVYACVLVYFYYRRICIHTYTAYDIYGIHTSSKLIAIKLHTGTEREATSQSQLNPSQSSTTTEGSKSCVTK